MTMVFCSLPLRRIRQVVPFVPPVYEVDDILVHQLQRRLCIAFKKTHGLHVVVVARNILLRIQNQRICRCFSSFTLVLVVVLISSCNSVLFHASTKLVESSFCFGNRWHCLLSRTFFSSLFVWQCNYLWLSSCFFCFPRTSNRWHCLLSWTGC